MGGDDDEIRDRGLGALAEAFPEEVAAAIALARAQREALAAMPPDPRDAS